MFWLEYVSNEIPKFLFDLGRLNIYLQHLKEITPLIVDTVDFIVNTLPKIQYWISGGSIIIGLCLLMIGYLRLRNNKAVEAKAKTKEKGMKN